MDSQNVQKAIRETLNEFGKLGLLIDDNEDSPCRIARELYYADALPAFWVVVRSIACATEALRLLVAGGSTGARAFLEDRPCLVIVDRHLFEHCRPGSERSVRLDDDAKSGCAAYLAQLDKMTSGEDRPASLLCCFITTHPLGKPGEASDLDWLPRSPWVMTELRDAIRPNAARTGAAATRLRSLRHYGVNAEAGRSHDSGRQWKHQAWNPMLGALAKALDAEQERDLDDEKVEHPSQSPVVLLTGAGVSLQSGPYGPGIPKTNALLFEAAWRLEFPDPRAQRALGPLLLDGKLPCACTVSTGHAQPSGAAPSLTEFRQAVRREVTTGHVVERYPDLLEAFGDEDAQERFAFYHSFRTVMQRFDHGFSYRHWLMAQLPWSCIITTNFDNFHERAAMAAASHPAVLGARSHNPEERIKLSHATLRRGNPGPPTPDKGSRLKWDPLWRSCRLFKPYGTLDSPAPLVLNQYGMKNNHSFSSIFQHAFSAATSGWLVVLGHSMLDEALQKNLATVLRRRDLAKKLNVVWVVPEAQAAVNGDRSQYSDALRKFPALVKARMAPPSETRDICEKKPRTLGDSGGAFSATALEFLYDLALKFDERARAGSGYQHLSNLEAGPTKGPRATSSDLSDPPIDEVGGAAR